MTLRYTGHDEAKDEDKGVEDIQVGVAFDRAAELAEFKKWFVDEVCPIISKLEEAINQAVKQGLIGEISGDRMAQATIHCRAVLSKETIEAK